jgi:hypothetical protein
MKGPLLAVIIWQLDLYLLMKSVPINTISNLVIYHSPHITHIYKYIQALIVFFREWISYSNITLKAKPEMWDTMRNPFRAIRVTYMNISRYTNIDKFVDIQYIFLLARRSYSWLFQLAQMWKLLAPGVGLVDLSEAWDVRYYEKSISSKIYIKDIMFIEDLFRSCQWCQCNITLEINDIQYIFLLARRSYSWLFQLAQMWKLLAPGVGLVDFLTPA